MDPELKRYVVTRVWKVEAKSTTDAIMKAKNWSHYEVRAKEVKSNES